MKKITRHIIGISGGKDSTALAIYLRDKMPDTKMEYVFCDTGKELPETYSYIEKLEAYLNQKIVKVPEELPNRSKGYDFDYFYQLHNGYLPSAQQRWCTKKLKLDPFMEYIGDGDAINYVGIRADENRLGYISKNDNIKTVFPFVDDGIDKDGVLKILEDAGLGLPEYYEWRTRSGCYFCFYQSKKEWLGLRDRHPELYEKAKDYEKEGFTWREDISLTEMAKLDKDKLVTKTTNGVSPLLSDILDDEKEDTNYEKPCVICHL